jgi:hypothetical protein
MWEKRLKDALVSIYLYELGMYTAEKLEQELNTLISDFEDHLCNYLRERGVKCYRDIRDEYPLEDAMKVFEDQSRRLAREKKYELLYLARLSRKLYKPESLTLDDKIAVTRVLISHLLHILMNIDVVKVHAEALSEIKKIREKLHEKAGKER